MNTKIFQPNNVAIYCRLSREDNSDNESSSIKNQKSMLSDYAVNKGWNIFNVYVDDGYSGGNFNRPAFKQLITDVEDGHVNIILTKDLSRLGRNYIEQGYYLEDYFPSKKVRFIAVNDNYDSINGEDDIAPFKSIFNQYYLKDISRKIKSANLTRIKKGKLPNGNHIPLYGYKHDSNNERILDEETSPVVKKIFEMYAAGTSSKNILDYLYDHRIYTSGYYNYLKYNYHPELWENVPEDKKYKWTFPMIYRIVCNEEYLGHLVLQKKKTISYKTHKRELSKEDEKYYFANRFPAIIDEYTFNRCKEMRNHKSKSKISSDINEYHNILFCSSCGKALSPTNSITSWNQKREFKYICRCGKCTHHVTVLKKDVDEFIKLELPNFINFCISNEKNIKKYAKTYKQNITSEQSQDNTELDRLIERNNKLNKLLQTLFERSVLGELPQETYNNMVSSYKKEFEENSALIDRLEKNKVKPIKKDYVLEVNEFMKFIYELKDCVYTNEKLLKVIDKIFILRNNKNLAFKIVYKGIPDLLEDYKRGK